MPLTITPDQEIDTDVAVTDAPETERFTITLPIRFAAWLHRRASLHGDTAEGHVERILREYKAQYDTSGANNARQVPPEKGETAITFRPR